MEANRNGSKRIRLGWPAGLLLLAGGLLAAGCTRDGQGPAQAPPPAPVAVGKVARRDVPVQVRVIGAVEAYSAVTIRSRVPGQILQVAFQRGQEVRQGDLLFQIDPRPYEAALAAARANLARDIAQARNARDEAKFQEEIFRRSAGTQREYDRAVAAAEAAEAQVLADQAAVQYAEIQLGYTTIAAPVTGRAGDLLVQEGSVVKADDTPLVEITQVEPIYAAFSVAEKYLPQIRQYMAAGTPLVVEATIPQTQIPPAQGVLTFIDNRVDRATGMIQMKGTFANEDRRLWPGQFVNVALTLTSRPDAVVVPSQAVQTGQDGSFVFVVNPDDTVSLRPVRAGETWNDLTVIEQGDLQAGQTVVTDGQLRLTDGVKVAVRTPTTQPAPAMAQNAS